MSEQFSLSYNPQLSPFDDVSFVSSPSLDSWAADFIGSGGSTLYADPTDDARVLPSQRSSTDLDPAFRVDYPDKPGRHPANSHDGNLQSTDPPGTTCACQQNILSKLSDISATSRLAHSNPFDTSLAENKNIIALCAFIVDCPNKQHDQDIALMLTGLALITHVIAVYDHRLRASYTDRDSDCAVAHFTLNHLTEVDFNQSSALTNREVLGQQPHRTKPFANVRLRLGSYQLDLKDEAMLQSSLLRIELSKIGTLIASFERRFCTFDYQNATGPLRNEPKPLGEVIAHLKKRLKVNYECLASF
ncbi:MAG: hypothetical protein L6R39_000840 [Caloplaca ligustica]|nr:MAG: hypothetical protein L6R39_000840 [Caloplaca ligustica]